MTYKPERIKALASALLTELNEQADPDSPYNDMELHCMEHTTVSLYLLLKNMDEDYKNNKKLMDHRGIAH